MNEEKSYYTYIMANKPYGTLYTGVTNDVAWRSLEHKANHPGSFTEKHGIHMLVYYEEHGDIRDAIKREKQIKRWRRQWKIELIESKNLDWEDLSIQWNNGMGPGYSSVDLGIPG